MKKHLLKFVMAVASIAWIGGVTSSTHAEQLTLQDLLNGQNITVGNTLFHDFQNFSSTASGALAIDPSQVWVIPTLEGGKFGLTFVGNGQFAAGSGQLLSGHFEFLVSGRAKEFNAASLNLTASAHGDGSGQIVGTIDNETPGMSIRSTSPVDYRETKFPDPKDRLHVGIDIRLSGGAGPDAISSMDSFTFCVDNPEPGTMTLLGIGAVGLLGYRWRRARKAIAA